MTDAIPTDAGEPNIAQVLEVAFSEAPTPLTPDALRKWCQEERESLIEHEVSFSEAPWTFLHQMELLADALTALAVASAGCKIPMYQTWEYAIGGFRTVGCGENETLCASCCEKKASAIRTLLGRNA